MSDETQNVSVKANTNGIGLHLALLTTVTLALLHAFGAIHITLLAALAPLIAWFGIMVTILVAMVAVAIIATILEALAGKSNA